MIARRQKAISPGSKIRVLVVDDSVVIRRLVTHALGEDSLIEVVGTAPDGVQALARVPQLNPDAITLDIEMPEMDGLATLRQLKKSYPEIRVIMFSTLTDRGAAATLEALSAGADDYVTKAANAGSLDRSLERLRSELVPKIKQFFELPGVLPNAAGLAKIAAPTVAQGTAATRLASAYKVLAIGVSTGGPQALAELIPRLPASFPIPVLIVQHMPPVFTRLLAERLQAHSKVPVREAAEGMAVEPGVALIAPGDFHMRLKRVNGVVRIALDKGPPENSCRPAVDVLFRSVAEVFGAATLCAVLTGMGQDGLRGVQNLKALGASVLVQDHATSVVWGMPGAVAQAGLADSILPLQSIATDILRRTQRAGAIA